MDDRRMDLILRKKSTPKLEMKKKNKSKLFLIFLLVPVAMVEGVRAGYWLIWA